MSAQPALKIVDDDDDDAVLDDGDGGGGDGGGGDGLALFIVALLQRVEAHGDLIYRVIRQDIIATAVEIGARSGNPQAVAVARGLAEPGEEA